MRDRDCVAFLRWCLPQMGLRWRGFRKVRRTVCKRVTRRMRVLGLADVAAYESYLGEHPSEWGRLDAFCRIPISRFWRDRAVFDWLAADALPARAAAAARRRDPVVRCWSAGCASGEEPYSLRMAWAQQAEIAQLSARIEIIATDAEEIMIARAQAGRYSEGSLRSLPPDWRARAFARDGDLFVLRPAPRDGVVFRQQDLRKAWPDGPFDIILCRNGAFTYFDTDGQCEILVRIVERLRPDGLLIIGGHEQLPEGGPAFVLAADSLPVYRRADLIRDRTASP